MKQKILSMTQEEIIELVESVIEKNGPVLVEKVTIEGNHLVVIGTELMQNLGILFSGYRNFDSRKQSTFRLRIPDDENGEWVVR